MIISLSQEGRLRSTVPDKLSRVGGQFLSVPPQAGSTHVAPGSVSSSSRFV